MARGVWEAEGRTEMREVGTGVEAACFGGEEIERRCVETRRGNRAEVSGTESGEVGAGVEKCVSGEGPRRRPG